MKIENLKKKSDDKSDKVDSKFLLEIKIIIIKL